MLLKIDNLSKRFKDKQVLDNVSLSLERGKVAGLLGKNGAGKSTLIKAVNDLVVPDSGTIEIQGMAPGVESKKRISYLADRIVLNPRLNAKQAMDQYETYFDDFDRSKATRLLERIQVDESQPIKTLSKGMQEKLMLILALSRQAELYIFDEPLGGVDPASRDEILDLILENLQENSSMLISTHLISDVERILDEVIIIDEGKILLQEEADALRARSGMSVDEYFRGMFK